MAMTASETGKRLQWPQECLDACQELNDHITNQPLASWSPASLLTEHTCLVAMTDASDDAIAISLFVVKMADARQVTKEHLKDPKMATLIAIKSHMLNSGERKWGTYEAELCGMKMVVEIHGSFITTATARFPTSGPDFKAKIGFLSDSTTAIAQWRSLSLPCLLYTSPSPRDRTRSRMPSSA